MPRPRIAQSSERRSAGVIRLGWSALGRFMAPNLGMSSLALAMEDKSALVMAAGSSNPAISRYVRRGSPVVHSFTPRRVKRFNPLRGGGLVGHLCSFYVLVSPARDSECKCPSTNSTAPSGPLIKPTVISAGFAGRGMRRRPVKRSCSISARFCRRLPPALRVGRTSTSMPHASFGRPCARAACMRRGATPTAAIRSFRIAMRGNGSFTPASWSGSRLSTGSAGCCMWTMAACPNGWSCRTANISTSRSRGSWSRQSGRCRRPSRSNPRLHHALPRAHPAGDCRKRHRQFGSVEEGGAGRLVHGSGDRRRTAVR
jgi:hypothetical protein